MLFIHKPTDVLRICQRENVKIVGRFTRKRLHHAHHHLNNLTMNGARGFVWVVTTISMMSISHKKAILRCKISTQQPKCRPQSLSFRQLDSSFILSISTGPQPVGGDATRGKLIALVFFSLSHNFKESITGESNIFGSICIVFQLIVAPTVATHVMHPDTGIGGCIARAIKL